MSAAGRTTVRLVVQRVLGSLTVTLPLPLIYAAGSLTWIKVARPESTVEAALAWGHLAFLAVPLAFAVREISRPRPAWWGAQRLDRHHGLAGRVANALSFQRLEKRTPLMEAAIDDALACALTLEPRRAAPIRLPAGLLVSLGIAAAILGLRQLEVRTSRFVPEVASHFVPLELPADDVELLRELADELQANAEDPEALAAMRRFNQLIEDIADRRLDRHEVFQRLEQLEQSLLDKTSLEEQSLDEALAGLGKALDKSRLTKPAAEALKQKNLADTEQALRELAEKLRKQPKSINRAELERLRQALSEASKQTSERLDRIAEQRRQVEEGRRRLLGKKKDQAKGLSKKDQQALDRTERQLKRLDRQKQQATRGREQLSNLDKALADAAKKLMDELGDAAKHLEQGAQDIHRIAKKRLSAKEKQQLKKQLEELRQMLRQNKGDNSKRQEMLERFRRLAQGQQGKPGGPEKGNQRTGQQGKGTQPGQLRLGPGQAGGADVPIPVPGSAPGTPGSDSSGPGPGGDHAGSSSAPINPTKTDPLKGQVEDVAAAGIDSGEGAASSEVVYGAAERGFADGAYRKIYTDYKTVAEEVMQSDEIPPGYKFYVRRYFQLIRPRN
jgi:hypothetical protein